MERKQGFGFEQAKNKRPAKAGGASRATSVF